jgi:hypothetical protein
MADSKISGLTEGTVVDPANDWFVYVDTSDATQNPLTGTTKKLRPSNIAAAGSNTQIQFNNNGVFGASSNLTWDSGNNRLINNSYISSTGQNLTFETQSGTINFISPYASTVNFTSAQSGQGVAFSLVTAEGKQAGFTHHDVASPSGRAFLITSQPGVSIRFLPSENELLRLNGFGVKDVTSTANWRISSPSAGSVVLKIQGIASQTANLQEWQNSSATLLSAISASGDLISNTTNGIKIGTATNQKLGFFNATPVVQQTGGAATATVVYTATEQGMLQKVYDALRTFGFLS